MLPGEVAQAIDRHFVYSRCTGARKALCIGINYATSTSEIDQELGEGDVRHKEPDSELRGCIRDAVNVRDFLIKHEGFDAQNIILLRDDTTDESLKPTKANIIHAMRSLVKDATQDDTLFFHFAGHGSQVEDDNEDELDGLDEALIPMDHADLEEGFIRDDVVYAELVQALPAGCRLTALVDSYLPCLYQYTGFLDKARSEHRALNYTKRRPMVSNAPDVVFWSGSKDGRPAGDGRSSMTQAFLKSMAKGKRSRSGLTYEQMLRRMRKSVSRKKFEGGERQKPQFGTYHPMDMKRQFFITA